MADISLEEMGSFFDRRLTTYDEHMLNDIESAREFYPFTASRLPLTKKARVLDLGCGTGLELEEYLKINPSASIVGIDLASGMLGELKRKLAGYDVTAILGSYFDLPFGEECFDAAVSVESLHHFTADEKLPLYKKLYRALKSGGYFVLTDYFADTNEREAFFRGELERMQREQGKTADSGEFYHYDTPLTVEHESETLIKAGFSRVELLGKWKDTRTLKAYKTLMATRE